MDHMTTRQMLQAKRAGAKRRTAAMARVYTVDETVAVGKREHAKQQQQAAPIQTPTPSITPIRSAAGSVRWGCKR